MDFDGAPLKINDSVYDVAYGPGIVKEISRAEDFIVVDFGGRCFSFSPKGQSRLGRKTLFWRDPIGTFFPTKDDSTWDKFVKIRDSAALALGIRSL